LVTNVEVKIASCKKNRLVLNFYSDNIKYENVLPFFTYRFSVNTLRTPAQKYLIIPLLAVLRKLIIL